MPTAGGPTPITTTPVEIFTGVCSKFTVKNGIASDDVQINVSGLHTAGEWFILQAEQSQEFTIEPRGLILVTVKTLSGTATITYGVTSQPNWVTDNLPSVDVASGFSPTSIANLGAWWRAGDVSLDLGNNVEQMDDLSGAARHMLQSTDANQPELVASHGPLGGQPALEFAGAHYMRNAAIGALFAGVDTPYTIFTVSDITVGALWAVSSDVSFNSYEVGRAVAGINSVRFRQDSTGAGAGAFVLNDAHDTPTVRVDRLNGATGIANTFVGSLSSPDWDMALASTDCNQMILGVLSRAAGPSFGNFLTGFLAETLVYLRALTLDEINDVSNYLSDKYGLTWVDKS